MNAVKIAPELLLAFQDYKNEGRVDFSAHSIRTLSIEGSTDSPESPKVNVFLHFCRRDIVMNYQKLGTELAMAVTDAETLDEEEAAFKVFIRTAHAPNTNEVTYLKELGISCEPANRRIFTATLSARAVDELSEQPWVSSLRLSQKLQLHRQSI